MFGLSIFLLFLLVQKASHLPTSPPGKKKKKRPVTDPPFSSPQINMNMQEYHPQFRNQVETFLYAHIWTHIAERNTAKNSKEAISYDDNFPFSQN